MHLVLMHNDTAWFVGVLLQGRWVSSRLSHSPLLVAEAKGKNSFNHPVVVVWILLSAKRANKGRKSLNNILLVAQVLAGTRHR